MGVNLWLTIYLGLGCLALATVLTFFFPETLPTKAPALQRSAETTETHEAQSSWTLHQWLHVAWTELARLGDAALRFAKANWQVVALLFTLLVTTLGRFAQEILLQYVHKRYGWSWAQVSIPIFPFILRTTVWMVASLRDRPS